MRLHPILPDQSKSIKCTSVPGRTAASATGRRTRVARPHAGVVHRRKLPVFILANHGAGQRYVIQAKTADESTIRLLLVDRKKESLTVYTDCFRTYDPLEEDDEFGREYVVHGDGEYADGQVHINTCESHASLTRW